MVLACIIQRFADQGGVDLISLVPTEFVEGESQICAGLTTLTR